MKSKAFLAVIFLLASVPVCAQDVLAVFDSRGECARAQASWFNDQWAAEKGAGDTTNGRSNELNPFICGFVNGRWSLVLR